MSLNKITLGQLARNSYVFEENGLEDFSFSTDEDKATYTWYRGKHHIQVSHDGENYLVEFFKEVPHGFHLKLDKQTDFSTDNLSVLMDILKGVCLTSPIGVMQ